MAAPHQPPAADGESGESQKPDLMELNRDQLMACSSCSSFAELVGAVGPVRSAGTDLEWASALAGNPGTPPLIVDTTEEVRKVMETLMEVVGGDYDNETAKDAALKVQKASSFLLPRYADTRYGAVAIVATSGWARRSSWRRSRRGGLKLPSSMMILKWQAFANGCASTSSTSTSTGS